MAFMAFFPNSYVSSTVPGGDNIDKQAPVTFPPRSCGSLRARRPIAQQIQTGSAAVGTGWNCLCLCGILL
jgi:hypothetical protein